MEDHGGNPETKRDQNRGIETVSREVGGRQENNVIKLKKRIEFQGGPCQIPQRYQLHTAGNCSLIRQPPWPGFSVMA